MHKLLFLLAALLTFSVTACNRQKKDADMNTPNDSTRILVAYFSATGTTEAVARRIASAASADLYAITPEKPYTAADLDWTDEHSRSTVEMKDSTSRPAIKADADIRPADYDVIFLGYPIWWYIAPTIVNTFIEQHDLRGKKIIPFATSGGSGIEKSVAAFRRQYPDLQWQAGRLLNHPADGEVEAWTANVLR